MQAASRQISRNLSLALVFGISMPLLNSGCEAEPKPFMARVCLELAHHGVPHQGATVYQNFGEGFPGYGPEMASRVDRMQETGRSSRVCFDSLRVGKHWFAAEGYDSFIADSVRGSRSLEISTLQEVYEVDLPVSEQH